jgi:cell pole-organizing protein PopZ
MEEILASIRRIIADDQGRAGAEDAASDLADPEPDGEAPVAGFPRTSPSLRVFGREEDEDFGSEPAPAASLGGDEPLLSREADASVSQAFGALAHTVLAGSPRPMEDIVREMLRPMLRTWLDDNLPTIVERLVRAEIERVARGGR